MTLYSNIMFNGLNPVNALIILFNFLNAYGDLILNNEWLLFNSNSAIFQLYHGENKLIFNEILMRSALY